MLGGEPYNGLAFHPRRSRNTSSYKVHATETGDMHWPEGLLGSYVDVTFIHYTPNKTIRVGEIK